jgi:putative membrane protein insertion efficiency factor
MIRVRITKIFIFLVKIYQYLISPLLGPNCRFMPTCSRYTIEAIEKHGIMKGILLSSIRIAKCNPLGGCGCDPVPQKFKFIWEK